MAHLRYTVGTRAAGGRGEGWGPDMGFELTIVTPEGERFRAEAERVVLPGSEGDFGVLAGHEGFLTPLRVGAAEILAAGETRWAAMAEGFAEVQGDRVTVLVDSCELAADIDTARAERARERAEHHLARLDPDADRERYEAFESALDRARNRLAVGERRR